MRPRGIALSFVLVLLTVPLANLPAAGADHPTSPANEVVELALDETEPALLSHPLQRGGVQWHEQAATANPPVAKTVDGDTSDWVGQASRLGGTTVLDQGELIYQDFLFDDFGADDGKDAQRNADLGPAYDAQPRLERIEALTQAAGEQFGADEQDPTQGYLTGPAHYGDATYPDGTEGQADLLELRLAADADHVYVLARLAALQDPGAPVLYLLIDDGPNPPGQQATCMGELLTETGDRLLALGQGLALQDLRQADDSPTVCKQPLSGVEVAVDADGATNAIEASLPRSLVEDEQGDLRVAAAVAVRDPEQDGEPGQPMNVAFRQEPAVANWFDRHQAMALHDRTVDPFFQAVDLDQLTAGTTIPWAPTPGYHERIFPSDPAISEESLEQGPKETIPQHYGLYLPEAWAPGQEHPLTFWLHWRGGTAHQAAAWTPRVFEQLGDERETPNIMVSPRGRGTSTWYAGAGHVDVLQVYEDVHEVLDIDEDRRYLSGYSMGGYGSYLFGLLYPDRFAAAYPISGAMTIGLWAGVDDQGRDTTGANGGDGNLENTYRLLENARNLPYVIHHGTDDELVPITGVQRVAAKLATDGYRYQFQRFLGYEHFTQAIADQWADGADYLDRHARDQDPGTVVYKRVPALEHAIETLNARDAEIDLATDGAYWVSDMALRQTSTTDPSVHGLIQAESHAIADGHLTAPEAGAASPGHSTPYVMDGLAWTSIACVPEAPCPGVDPIENAATVELINVGAVTLDAARMQLDTTGAETHVALTTDGPARLTLEGPWSCQDGSHAVSSGAAIAVTSGAAIIETGQAGTVEAVICG